MKSLSKKSSIKVSYVRNPILIRAVKLCSVKSTEMTYYVVYNI